MKHLAIAAAASCLLSSMSFADDTAIGRIQMIQPYVPQSLVYVHLQGLPQLNGGGVPEQLLRRTYG
jgi:hypothetical protein